MAFQDKLESEPWRFDYFTVLRQLERTFKDQPRIGDSATISEEFVKLGQDPFMAFPGSNIASAVQSDDKAIQIFTKFLGLLGPQGALPLAITEEAYYYHLAQDDAFARSVGFPGVRCSPRMNLPTKLRLKRPSIVLKPKFVWRQHREASQGALRRQVHP